jgi:hypothetical protein
MLACLAKEREAAEAARLSALADSSALLLKLERAERDAQGKELAVKTLKEKLTKLEAVKVEEHAVEAKDARDKRDDKVLPSLPPSSLPPSSLPPPSLPPPSLSLPPSLPPSLPLSLPPSRSLSDGRGCDGTT